MHTSSHTYYPGHESRISSSQNHQTAVPELCRLIPDPKLYDVLKQIQTEFSSDTYRLELLLEKFRSFYNLFQKPILFWNAPASNLSARKLPTGK